MTQSTAIIPDYCILKCVQILFDSKCCTNCEIGTEFWEKLKKNKQILFEKIRLELCFGKVLTVELWLSIVASSFITFLNYFHSFLACKDGRCCQNTTNSHKFYGNIVHFFEAFNSSWCISAMNLNEIVCTRKKSYFLHTKM